MPSSEETACLCIPHYREVGKGEFWDPDDLLRPSGFFSGGEDTLFTA